MPFEIRTDICTDIRSRGATVATRITSRTIGALSAVALLGSGGCKAVTLAYGADVATARSHADSFAAAIQARFTNVVRTPRFNQARVRIARYALAPSKLAPDTALWTTMRSSSAGPVRDVELVAGMVNGQYRFAERANAPLPARTGDERHRIRLEKLPTDENDWIWRTEVDHAIGAMPPARITDVFRALFSSSERPSGTIRDDYRSAFPRTSQALGRMFSVDSILTAAQPDGSTLVALHVLVSDDRLKSGFPAFAKFVRKYVEPARYRYRLTDRSGAEWFDAHALDQRLVVRFRSHRGELQPIAGVARRMPDSLQLHVDAMAKLGLFTVGVTKLQGEFVHVRSATERAWAMRFAKEPEWHLPLFTERMLHTPLKRPFEGGGMVFKLGFKSGPQGQTMLSRTFDVAIRESAIVRFLGNLGFTAMNDYAGPVELEEHRFIAEAMAAIRADIGGIAAP